jgi:hypothetical protein
LSLLDSVSLKIEKDMAVSAMTTKKRAMLMAATTKMNAITTSLAAMEKKKEAARMKATIKKKAVPTITAILAHLTGSSTQHSARRM